MGSDLRFVMPLLRLLNQSPQLRMNYQLLCSQLSLPVQDLQDTASAVNEIEPVLAQEGEDLVLLHQLDLLDPEKIFSEVTMRGRFALKDVSVSTNLELMNERENLVSGDALVAEIQTQGRSRRGTKWLTSIGTNIMLSMAFRFPSLQHLLGFSLAVGVATVTALEMLGVHGVKLKWPNDVVVGDKKLAGILIESVPVGNDGVFAIVGVGLNVHPSYLINEHIDRPYICVDELGAKLTRNDICISLINEFKYAANNFKREGLEPFLEQWKRHDALLGNFVEMEISSHRRVSGKILGVNNLGELILESNSGRIAIRAGHILSIRGC
ncbi:MAG TPA: biotin--[acetyl-CoA-carboxylase] ligase [Candidatus Anaerobiospirillum pullistercoris]|uniref:Biotin--[acetyl-CoA-carboxylase] ligase n=1 Tax=Candidatus Anaerobiospirillum pullistercoris TaxID=2838452 RepID=A0A9D1WEC0_9GAMM|nr:biotin--[acetyl-CoA-carboxylase] ligase [Candidatus Anaerobiospirillum pullistercoris]